MPVDFPLGFFWGVSTSAYQIEGLNTRSDLWRWEKKKSWERSGRACNSWELFEEDLKCLRDLGVTAYRFSIEWGRIFKAHDQLDRQALMRYSRQMELLEKNGIIPFVCLHHFTNPAWLTQRCPGGWLNPAVVEQFRRYAEVVGQWFSGRVKWWIPFNEPNVYALQAYGTGYFPPGRRAIWRPLTREVTVAIRHLVEAHAAAYEVLKRRNPDCRIGVAQNLAAVFPFEHNKACFAAAKRWDEFFHWTILDAMTKGRLDEDADGRAEVALGKMGDTLDFVGVNYYTRVYVRSFPGLFRPLHALPLYSEFGVYGGRLLARALGVYRGGLERDDLGHEQFPEGLSQVLRAAWSRYNKPLFVMENGVAAEDDQLRSRSLKSHLSVLSNDIGRGLPVLGYFHWSLMDNYEWGSFRSRFGLYAVDRGGHFARTMKPSAQAYQSVIKSGALSSAGPS
ncbi:MAG: glycoside hydrolase family 1 protein [Elusimicrobia bacterium]|nr:glycoside hydrolase family 1 protein [Elusimicrobiota bacterium]